MADIFISYSRKDSAFGHRLHAKLLEEKRDVWMDWEDIPDTVEWWGKIREGILASDNVAVIISPESIASPICNLEIAYARELNKRILPLLYRDTDETKALVELVTQPLNDLQRALLQDRDLLELGRDNWKVLASLNWINFTDEARFQEKSQNLTKVLDTDFEYVDEHTRLLVRATDWENRKRSPSLLLRGDDLETAEVWLENAGGKNPQPALLHHEYIAESRRTQKEEERRISRLRRASLVLGVMVVLAAVAIIGAVMTARDANAQRDVAYLAGTRAAARGATVAVQATVFAFEQERVATLAVAGVIVPPSDVELPGATLLATATAFTALTNWTPVIEVFDGVEMGLVPAGCFWMGTTVGGEQDEYPAHQVCFDELFWIDLYEVTNAQFEQFNRLAQTDAYRSEPEQPRTDVRWFEARDFCMLRGVRLPTEAEWEYAARGPDSLVYPWGNEFIANNVVYVVNSIQPAVVGSRSGGVSWVGAYDMSGNVGEWVSTAYDDDFRIGSFPYPYLPDDGREDLERMDVPRVVRGGSYELAEVDLRSANRSRDDPFAISVDYGFRCARSS